MLEEQRKVEKEVGEQEEVAKEEGEGEEEAARLLRVAEACDTVCMIVSQYNITIDTVYLLIASKAAPD